MAKTAVILSVIGAGPVFSAAVAQPARVATVVARPFIHEVGTLHTPPTTQDCLNTFGFHCYQPAQLAQAYDLNRLHSAGIDGRGKTILIVDSFGSPTIQNDLHVFDQTFGIPDPPSLQIRTDASTVLNEPMPPFDVTNSDMTGWAAETTLDVEWSHVFAPGANIVLEETPVSETEGVQGFPEIVAAENYAINNGIGDVISQSFGATEQTFPNNQAILNLRSSFVNAQKHNVTVLGSSGDTGATDYQLNLSDLYTFAVNSWPSADPLVTSVGGTMLLLDNSGNRIQPDVVWNDLNTVGGGAAGGGVSAVFQRPSFQDHVQSITGKSRGTPDISLSAALDGAVVYYHTYLPSDSQSSRGPWHIVAGTSEASPELAGVIAMADQVNGADLGLINKALYSLPYGGGLVDVTTGNNTFGPFQNSDGNTYTVQGFNALHGYDLASGLGTLSAGRFVPALANAGGHGGGGNVTCPPAGLSFASIRGDLTVPAGAACALTDVVISGNVKLGQGSSVTGQGVTVLGDVQSQKGGALTFGPDAAGQPSIVQGSVRSDGSSSVTLVSVVVGNDVEIQNQPSGGGQNVICGSTIGDNVQVHNNLAQTVIGPFGEVCGAGNSVTGSVQVQNNTVAGAAAAVINSNVIGHDLQCQNNSLPPSGSANTVHGHEQGQCVGF